MNTAEKILTTLVGLLAVLGVIFSLIFLFTGGGNDGFAEYPVITQLHVLPGLVYLALAPLQFSSSLRRRYPSYHRRAGRVLATLAIVLGLAALFIGIVIPFSGLPEQLVIAFFGTFFLIATVNGFQCARARKFAEHREWMLRAFAIGLSIVTMRLIFLPMLITAGEPTVEQIQTYSIIAFSISFALHSAFAEFWIRFTRPKPSLHSARLAN